MQQSNKLVSICENIIRIIFIIIMSALTIMSLFWHCEVEIFNYYKPRNIESHRPVLYIFLAIAIIAGMLLIFHIIDRLLSKSKNEWKVVTYVLLFGTILVVAVGSVWIMFNDTMPKHDQKTVFEEARRLAGYLSEEYNTSYFETFPRNKGLVLVMAGMLRIFGDTQVSFRILNLVGAGLLFLCVCLTVKKVWKNAGLTIMTALCLMCFYPIIIYTSYLYGTLLSAAFSSLSIFMAVSFCEDKKTAELAVSAVSMGIAMQMHQSAAIAMIAIILYILVHIKKEMLLKVGLYLVMLIGNILLLGKAADITYENITGAQLKDAAPSSAYIYMGLTSYTEDGGPGAQDASFYKLFAENNYDAEATNKAAIKLILNVCGEYIQGERSLDFFVEKVKYQWLDPTLGARKIIDTNDINMGEPVNSEAYMKFYNSGLRGIVFKLSIVMLIIIYGLNLFTGIKLLGKNQRNDLHFFIQIFLIGGFTFQLMWESLSRYCFSYYVWLIPEAVFGIVLLYNTIFKNLKKKA